MILTPHDKKTEMPKPLLKAFTCGGELRYDRDCTSVSRAVPKSLVDLFCFYSNSKDEKDLPPLYNIVDAYNKHFAYIMKDSLDINDREFTVFILEGYPYGKMKLVCALCNENLINVSYSIKVVIIPQTINIFENSIPCVSKVYSNCYYTGLIQRSIHMKKEISYNVDIRALMTHNELITELSESYFYFIKFKSFWRAYDSKGNYASLNSDESSTYKMFNFSISDVNITVDPLVLTDKEYCDKLSCILCIPEIEEYGVTCKEFAKRVHILVPIDSEIQDESATIIPRLFT